MKVRAVAVNKRKRQLELTMRSGGALSIPFARLDPRPTRRDPIARIVVDKELANEAVTYVLASGRAGSVHVDHVLDYNADPTYLADVLIHKLTVEARRRADASGISRRELARRLRTSAAQLYRLLDPANTRKSLGQLIALLHLLNCDVGLVVKPRRAA